MTYEDKMWYLKVFVCLGFFSFSDAGLESKITKIRGTSFLMMCMEIKSEY
jgi:hypothetical protein